ncbi:hypothetical protein FCULG_00008261 [Fusarium culmorum]|uniref:Uncharacterized protein n=1 Tax=Fusarium culmorum TaxID=5516 RepID=A0A2T4H3N8_FUSCU|nr:hypothetical protein FCULG_00008261 [Fusarium culmorum]
MALNSPRHRSVSQSSLQSTYGTHESTSNPPRQRSPSQPRLPFQSLNETSVLLRPPGPLESMLKTTTETGDLGIYSINLPSLGTRHHLPRSRASHSDKKRQSQSRHDGSKYGATRDDRKLLPSYRDPTSEILSLYGGSQTPIPASEDQRSHSLTTCSSRRVPSYKSSGTFSSQQSNSRLQRPRSPFSYPARLKRPGVRPSSPAVTDNGLVDYRRMVEIGRSAHRTTSGSYMTRGRRRYRQYPPLSLRPEYSRSASSLPMRTSSAPYYRSGADSSGALGDMIQLYPESPYRQFAAEDQSIRSASLTSIVEMYRGKSSDGSVQPTRSPCSVYYDYTEDCEETFSDHLLNGSPVCSPGGEFKHMSKENATQDASIEIDTRDKGHRESHDNSKISREPALRGRGTNPRGDPGKENNLATLTLAKRVSVVQSSDSSDSDWVWDKPEDITIVEDNQVVQGVTRVPSKATAPCFEERRPQVKENYTAKKLPSHSGQHHLNASTNIEDQNHASKQVTTEQDVQASKAHAKILSPSPISPAHQLRLSNSIPQLMKALPSLPHETQSNSQNSCAASSEDTRAHTNIDGSLVDSSVAVRSGNGTGESSLEPVFSSNDLRTPSHQRIQSQPHISQSRFKVRVKSSQSSGLRSKWIADSPKVTGRSSSSPVKPRLRLKVSRNRVSSKLMDLDDIHVRNEGIRQCKSLLELGDAPQGEASSDRSSFEEPLEEQLAQLNSGKPLLNIDEGTARVYSPQISDQFDISYPSPTKGIVMAELVLRSNLEGSPDSFDRQQQGFISRPIPRPLGHKTSGPQPNGVMGIKGRELMATSNIHEIDPATLGYDIISDSSDESTLAPSQITVLLAQRLKNKTLRVKRWVLELKRTVQKLMRRTSNRRQ